MKVNIHLKEHPKFNVCSHSLFIDSDSEQERPPRTNATIPSVAQALLPSTICASFAEIVKLLDDHAITSDGIAVYQVAYQVRFIGLLLFDPSELLCRSYGHSWLKTAICF